MRKIVTFAGAAALLLGTVAPAMAHGFLFRMPQVPTPSYNVSNTATVSTNVSATADTGDNDQDVKSGYNYMETGDATALSSAFTFANIFDGCNCGLKGDVTNKATVSTNVTAAADTGDNDQDASGTSTKYYFRYRLPDFGSTSYNKLFTGNAGSDASTWTVVNSAWTGMPVE